MKARKVRHLVAIATLASAVALLAIPTASASAAATNCWSLYGSETALKRETNASRKNHGLAPLPLDQDLSKVARRHSEAMATAGEPYHTRERAFSTLLTGGWTSVHENVGVASAVSADAATDIARLQRAFMDSPTHRENILTPGSDYIGVGVVRRDGKYFVTVLLVEGVSVGTSLRMPTC